MKSILTKFSIYKYALANIILVIGLFFFSVLVKSDPITDPSAPLSQQPTVKLDGTGIPKINITTPEAGVSHNKFKQFNVSPNGLILNNSKIGGTSRIGGAVVGNPNLKDSGSANVIINEVTGDTDSQLKGAIEVFGTRADVILANPNGVICNGCAFLNTGRATLTTGRPVVNGAQVDLHVTEGVVVVEGDGLSAPDGDAALVGRHVIIDGPVNARDEAYVSGGTQYHDHNQRKSRAAPVVNGRDVLFSVDASELGAMSAGQIRIHGNEAGLGVRAYGDLNSAGDIQIESAGDIAYRNANAAGKGIIRSNSDVTQYGNAIFGDTVSIAAGSYLLPLNAKLSSEKDIEINTDGLTQIEGEVTGDNIRIEARGGLKNSGFIMADGDLEIISGEGLSNFRRKLGIYDVTYENRYARYRQWYKRTYWRRYGWGWWSRWRRHTYWYSRWVTRFVERVEHRNLVEEHVANGGTLSGRNVNITAESDLSNTGAVIAATEDLTINALGDISNSYIMLIKQHEGGKHKEFHPGEILAGRNLTITGEGDLSNQASHIGAYGEVIIDVKGNVTNYLTADKYVTKQHQRIAGSDTYSSGSTSTGVRRYGWWWWSSSVYSQSHRWNTRTWLEEDKEDEHLTLNPGQIVSLAGDLSLKAKNYSALGSVLSAAGDLNLDVDENISLVQVVDTEKHSVTTTTHKKTNNAYTTSYGYQRSYGWWWWRRTYTRWYSTRRHYSSSHTKSANVERDDKTIVAASNLFGKNITIKAESIYAPGAKIAAEEDLSVLTTGSLYLEGDTPKDTSAATGLNVAEITHYNEWDYVDFSEDVPDFNVQDLGADKVAAINDGGETQDTYEAFTHSKELLRALYVLSQLSSGHEISDAAKAVGVQEWKTATSEKGFEYTLREGLVEGEKNFSVALLNRFDAATNSPNRLASDSNLIEKMAWRFVSEQAIDDIAESPYTVLHAKNITIGSDEDVSLLGGTLIDAAQDLKIVAGRDVLLAPVRGGVKGAVDAIATKYKSEGLWKLSPVSIGAGRDLSIVAGDDVYNIGGSLWADDSIVINAAGDIQNVGVRSNFKLTSAHGCGYSACGRTGYRFTPADMVAKGSILLTSGGSILNHAADIITDGSIYLQAGEDIINEAKTGKFTHVDYYRRWVKRKWYGKKTVYTIRKYAQTPVVRGAAIEAKGGDLILSAGRDLMNFGGLIEADGLLSASVGRDVLLNSKSVELITINHSSKSSSWLGWNYAGKLNSAEYNNFRGAYSVLRGDTVNIAAAGDLVARGARIQSQGDLTIAIDGNIAILPLQNTLYSNIKTEKKGFFSEKRNHTYRSNTVTNRTNIGSGSDLLISSTNKNIVIQAANLTAGGDLSLDASQGQISLLTAKEKEVEQIERYKANAVWWVAEQEGFIRENVIHNHIKAGGQIYFRANNGLLVEYEDKGDINHAIAELSKAPELAWMAQLRIRNDVDWRGIKPHYEEWYEKQEGLTEGAAAVIALAITVATGVPGAEFFGIAGGPGLGVGSSLLGFSAETAVTAAIDAGFTAIVSKATVSLINNKGDIGAVLEELGSAESLRSIAASIITAGVTHGLDAGFYEGTKGLYQEAGLVSHPNTFANLHKNLINNAVRGTVSATIRTAIEGGDIGDAVLSSLQSVGVNTVLSSVHRSIGDLTDGTGANNLPVANIIAHTIAGGLAAEALGESFASGASAALVSALAANAGLFDDMFAGDTPDQRAAKIGEIGRLLGGTASLLVGGGSAKSVNLGASISQSAVLNNYLTHAEIKGYRDTVEKLAKCYKDNNCTTAEFKNLQHVYKGYIALSAKNSKDLIRSCESGATAECTSRINDLKSYIDNIDISYVRDHYYKSSFPIAGLDPTLEATNPGNYGHDNDLWRAYRGLLDGSKTPEQAQEEFTSRVATKNGFIKVGGGALAIAGVTLCSGGSGGLGTAACAVAAIEAVFGANRVVEGLTEIATGEDQQSPLALLISSGGFTDAEAESLLNQGELAAGVTTVALSGGILFFKNGQLVKTALKGADGNYSIGGNSGLYKPTQPLGADGQPILRTNDRGNILVQPNGSVTCGQHSCAMVLNTRGQTVKVDDLIASHGPEFKIGTSQKQLIKLLSDNDVKSAFVSSARVKDLKRYTSNGKPAIATVKTGPDTYHAVVVDGVTKRNGQEVLAIRDPAGGVNGGVYYETAASFKARFFGNVIRLVD